VSIVWECVGDLFCSLGWFARSERIVCSKVPFFSKKISVCQGEVLRPSMCDVQALTSLFFLSGNPMCAGSDVSLHSAYIYDFSMYTYREREREFLQWLCVRMYMCASSTMNRKRRLKENPSSVMGSESSRLSVSSIRNASYSMIITIIMHTFFLDGRGVGLVWGNDIATSLLYTHTTNQQAQNSENQNQNTKPWEGGVQRTPPFLLLPAETSLMQLILSEFHGASSADRRQTR